MLKPEVELLRERVTQLTAELEDAKRATARAQARQAVAEAHERDSRNRESELFRLYAEFKASQGDEDEE